MNPSVSAFFEALYKQYNNPVYISPDPLELVRPFERLEDREIAGLICSTFALGRVDGILKACRSVLAALPSPRRDVLDLSDASLSRRIRGFRYRFFCAEDVIAFRRGMRDVLWQYGTVEECLLQGVGRSSTKQDAVSSGLQHLVTTLRREATQSPEIMLPLPSRGSACKRLHLYLRWMVRRDAVDPGGWEGIKPSLLKMPVDTHILQVARYLGITNRKQANEATSREITEFFQRLRPDDPVRYDFVLTRSGISQRREIRDRVYDAEFRVRPAS